MHVSDALSRLPSHNTQTGNKQEVKGLNVASKLGFSDNEQCYFGHVSKGNCN